MMMMEEEITFEKFYSGIKDHFSSNPNDYDAFRNEKSMAKRLKYLLDHDYVSKELSLLERSKTLLKTKPGEVVPWKKPLQQQPLLGSKSEIFPQMSNKVKLATSAKSGRCLVAKEKILTGTYV